MPVHLTEAIKYHKYSVIKEYVANDRNINCVDKEGNNIAMLLIKSTFEDSNFVNKQNLIYINSIFDLILSEPLFNHRHKNDMNEDLIKMCNTYLLVNKKNSNAKKLLKTIIHCVKAYIKPKPILIVHQNEHDFAESPYEFETMSPMKKQNCEIL